MYRWLSALKHRSENPVSVSLSGNIAGDGETPGDIRYFIVDFLGYSTAEPVDENDRLVETIVAPSPDGSHVLEIPEDTAATDAEGNSVILIEIRQVTAPQLPENTELIGSAFEFKPLRTTLDRSARLTLAYEANAIPDNTTSVGMAYYDSRQGWIYLATVSSTEGRLVKLTTSISRLAIFAILAQVEPPVESGPDTEGPPETPIPGSQEPASFQLSNLSIVTSSDTTKVGLTAVTRNGEEATISVDVTNTGGQAGSYTVVLMANGNEQGRQEVTLEPDETQTVTFTLGPNETGVYAIQIGDLDGSFVSELVINWWLFGGLIAVIVIIGTGIWFYLYRRNKKIPA